MGGPSIIYPVGDHAGEAIHELSVSGMNSADGIVLVNFPFGFGRVDHLVGIGLMIGMMGFVLVGIDDGIGMDRIGCGRPIAAAKTGHCEGSDVAGTVEWPIQQKDVDLPSI